MSYGVLESGFVKKTLATIKTEIETDFRNAYGTDIDIGYDGFFGNMIGIMSRRESQVWDLAQEIYTSNNVNEVTGASQDNLYSEIGMKRIDASKSYYKNALLWGTIGSIIPVGAQASQSATGYIYDLDEEVYISPTYHRAERFEIAFTGGGGEVYSFTLNAIPISYTTTSEDTIETTVDSIVSLITASAFTGSAVNEGDGFFVIYGKTADFTITSATGTVVETDYANAGDFTCESAGLLAVSVGSLDTVYKAETGWDAVQNILAGSPGRDAETDYAFRVRQSRFYSVGKATDEALRNNILNEVDGIVSCEVISNRTDETDDEGIPPHSFMVVVEGGDDDDIAQVIWQCHPSGIRSYGTTTVVTQDSQGRDQTIQFSRPGIKYGWVIIQREVYSEEVYPTDGDDQLTDAIYAWTVSEFSSGKDIIYQRFAVPVYTIPGVGRIIIKVAVTDDPEDTPTYVSDNIAIDAIDLAVFDNARITIEDYP